MPEPAQEFEETFAKMRRKVGASPVEEPARAEHDEPAPPPAESPEDYGTEPAPSEVVTKPAVLITPADWPNEERAEVDWLASQRIPRAEVTLLAGDGGGGKTDSALQLSANVARQAPDWFGHEIVPGPVVFVSAEEPENEMRRRLYWLGKRDDYGNGELGNLHLWFPADSGDSVLAVPDRNGIMQPTPLFRSIAAAIRDVAPTLVSVDNVACTFAGNQNDRVNVRSYVNLWRAVARGPSHPAVLLLDHPSLSGLTGGSGRGGSMDWWNACRSVILLRIPDDKAEADSGVRMLETGKSNYTKKGNPLRLVWTDGGLATERQPSSLHRLAKEAECEETFLRLLDERNAQGRPVYPDWPQLCACGIRGQARQQWIHRQSVRAVHGAPVQQQTNRAPRHPRRRQVAPVHRSSAGGRAIGLTAADVWPATREGLK